MFFKFLLVLILPLSLMAQVRVVDVRGEATVLLPGKHTADKIAKGDLYPNDSSIVTGAGSFVRLVYKDKSTMNIGPNSHIQLERHLDFDNGTGVIGILKGQVRSHVNKSNKEGNKLIIKTKVAAMGVRGTDFVIVYEPDNKAASLVTFNGDVAIVKNLPDGVDLGKLDETLNKAGVSVKAGQFAGLNSETMDVKEVVDVAPGQLEVLKKATLGIKTKDSVGDLGEGKIVDLKTAMAVPSSMGDVNRVTGVYIAPKGLTLTPAGFKAMNEDSATKNRAATAYNQELGLSRYTQWLKARFGMQGMNAEYSQGDLKGKSYDSAYPTLNLEYAQIRGLNRFYGATTISSVSMEDKGCDGCNSNYRYDGKSGSLVDVGVGYERNLSDSFKLGVELGKSDRPLLRVNQNEMIVTKESSTRASLVGRLSSTVSDNRYLYLGGKFDLYSMKDYSGNGFELNVGSEYLLKKGIGLSGELFYGQESYKNGSIEIDYKRNGVRGGVLFEF